MKETVNAFLQHLVIERGFSQNTLDAYSNDLNQFRDFVGKYLNVSDDDPETLRVVDLDLLNAYISELRDRKKGTAIPRPRAKSLRSVLFLDT